MSLPAAGLMSGRDGFEVARKYRQLDGLAKNLGTSLGVSFMLLSFMSLFVIPQSNFSNPGLIEPSKFEFISLLE